MRTVSENELVKALSDMEAIAKGGVSPGMSGQGNKIPKTTAEANGGLSNEGDKQEMAAKGQQQDGDFADDAEDDPTFGAWIGDDDAFKAEDTDDDEDSSYSNDDDDDDESMDYKKGYARGKMDYEKDKDMDYKKGSKASKSSISDVIKSNTNAGPVVDVSPFIENLVETVSESDMELRKSIDAMEARQGRTNTQLAKAMTALGNITLEVKKSLDQLMDQPAGERRSVLTKADIHERFEEPAMDFSKADVLDTLVNLAKDGKVTPIDVTRYEGTDTMEPKVQKAVQDQLAKSMA